MKHSVRFITPEEQHRFTGSQSNRFAGNFCNVLHHSVYVLLPLDDFDKEFTAGVILKPGESLFRYKTENSKTSGQEPLVKLDIERGLAYYLVEGAETPEFEKRGVKVRYINLLKTNGNS